jgi:hypothetical protein
LVGKPVFFVFLEDSQNQNIMNRISKWVLPLMAMLVTITGCAPREDAEYAEMMKAKTEQFKEVTLTADLSWLSENEREIIRILIRAADIMDDVFWMQAYGDKDALLSLIDNEHARQYARIHYGPWDRLAGNAPFYPGFENKPLGANFYPVDMDREEFNAWDNPDKAGQYTLVRRDELGNLVAIPYSEAYRDQHTEAARLLREAAELAEDQGLRNYLLMRADALLSNDYQPSDFAWMEMKESNIDFVVGPIEHYEDRLFGYKAAHEAYVLVKDPVWSAQLEKFNAMLPALQASMPVPEAYKAEVPGTESDINVYYALYYTGDCNAGSKSIAINLPNDEEVQLRAGSRKLQLKNSMQAKFEEILVPIADLLIEEEQRRHIRFDAFFENTTFHEVSHGMGIKNTINGKGTVREALREYYSSIEEAKADILGLYLVGQLYDMGEITSGELMDNYVTFIAGIFRSSRFGAASSHGIANMMRFNFFEREGAFTRQEDGTYRVHFEAMKEAVTASVKEILTIQGDGDYERARELVNADGRMVETLSADLDRVNEANIPIDIVFNQGPEVLGL